MKTTQNYHNFRYILASIALRDYMMRMLIGITKILLQIIMILSEGKLLDGGWVGMAASYGDGLSIILGKFN